MKCQFVLYNRNLKEINKHCVSPMHSNLLNSGRSFGGCAILWNKNIHANVFPIDTHNKRLCVVIKSCVKKLFIIVM